jgi:hypothetical protein
MDKLEKNGPCLDMVPLTQIFIFANLLTYFNIGINIIPVGSMYVKKKTKLFKFHSFCNLLFKKKLKTHPDSSSKIKDSL